jgi:hypothetical protein
MSRDSMKLGVPSTIDEKAEAALTHSKRGKSDESRERTEEARRNDERTVLLVLPQAHRR